MFIIAEKYRGYVAIPRSVQVLPIWGNAYDTALWLYCVLHASHRPYGELRPGQFYASQAQIAVELHWTRKTVGTALQRLAGKALLDVETSGKGTVITVAHWDEISSGRGFQEIECLGEEQPVQIIVEAYEEEPLWESR